LNVQLHRREAARLGVVLYDGVEPIDVAGTIGVVSMAARVLPAIEGVTIAHAAGLVALAGPWQPPGAAASPGWRDCRPLTGAGRRGPLTRSAGAT
jgi:hypothetical protein